MTFSVRILLPVALFAATALTASADERLEPEGKPSLGKHETPPPAEPNEKPAAPASEAAAPSENSGATTNATAPAREPNKPARAKPQRPAWPPPPEIIS